MDTPRLWSGRETRSETALLPRLARTALLCSLGCMAVAGAALAAPCADDDCREGAGSLDGIALAAQGLNLRSVDLGDAHAAATARAPDSVAPLLYLTPRVASILEEVFGDTPAEAADTVIDEPAADAPVLTDAPYAGPDEDPKEDPELYGPLSQAGNSDHLPKFQRQMYRTDI